MTSIDEWYELRNHVYAKEFAKAGVLLKQHPTLPEERNSIGETVLHFLVVENDIEGVQWLAKNGFNPNVENEFGQSTLFEAASLEYFEIVDWLLSSGADLNHRDQNGDNIFTYLEDMEKTISVNYLKQKNV